MFEPKIYKKNGLEAFRLVGGDGSEFFYEGAIDCNETELYKDTLGRLYYPVTAEIGDAVKYYVELDPQVPPIPYVTETRHEKAISRLVNASPRPETSLPEDLFVKPEAPQEIPMESPPAEPEQAEKAVEGLAAPLPVPEEPPVAASLPVPEEPPVAASLPVPEEPPAMKPEASEAIHAIFSPKADIARPAAEQPAGSAGPEKKAAPAQARKKRSLKWPFALAVIFILLASCAIGVYIVKPHAYDGLRSLIKGQDATPVPTAVPTEEPTPSPTPSPAPAPADNTPSPAISELIDSDSPIIATFAQAHTNATSAGNAFRQACDLFDYVNGQWTFSDNNTAPRMASEIAGTLEGTTKDYTALMVALMKSLGIESRVVIYYVDSDENPRYYPEVAAANTSAGFENAMQELYLWYGVTSPLYHSDGSLCWIALSMSSLPGIPPSDAISEYALSGLMVSPVGLSRSIQ